MAELFISYARKDKDEVYHIVDELERNGFKCWIDRNDKESGDEFKEVILDAIDSCEVFLYMVSPNSAESEWCKKEYNYAKGEKKIIPVLLKGTRQNRRLMFDFSLLNYIDYTNELDRDKLKKDLKYILNKNKRDNPLKDYISYLHNLAEEGDAEAQYKLAGYTDDEKMRFELLEKSAELGNINAIEFLVFTADKEKATKWCKIGAELGNSYCQDKLADCYYDPEQNDLDVEHDYTKAVEWYTKASEQNNASSQFHLALCYQNGTGIEQNYDKAIDLYTKAIDNNDSDFFYDVPACIQLCKELKSEQNKPLKRFLRRLKNYLLNL